MNKQIINLLTVGLTLLLTACGGSGNKGQAPQLVEQSKLGTVHTLTPEYTFTSTLAGTSEYQGSCSSSTTQATAGENTIELKLSKWWITYDDCALTITTGSGKPADARNITHFRTVYPGTHPLSDTGMTLCANFPRKVDGSFPDPDRYGNYADFKVGISCAEFGVTQTEDGWDGEFVIPAGQDATHGRDALAAQGKLEKVGAGHGGFDFTKLDKDGNELDYSVEEYACIRDNYTGLIWEVKTNGSKNSDLHSGKALYVWHNPDPETNGGLEGLPSTNSDSYHCSIEPCNTEKFIEVVNAESYCGKQNWRLPTYSEIASISNVQSADDKMEHYVENPVLRYAQSVNFTSEFIKKDDYRHILSSYNLALYFPAFILPKNWETNDNPLGAVLVSEPDDYQKPLKR